jgi:hypothetical protein
MTKNTLETIFKENFWWIKLERILIKYLVVLGEGYEN